MRSNNVQYIFPVEERRLFVYGGRILLLPLELIVHGICIGSSIYHQNPDGIWLSLFFAIFFGVVHFQNIQFRKYCLATWSFDGTTFSVYVKDLSKAIHTTQPFCIATTDLSFARRYSPEKYPFVMIWKPGSRVPYAEMGAYQALKKRDALIIPYDDQTIALLQEHLNIQEIPKWPRARVYQGNAR